MGLVVAAIVMAVLATGGDGDEPEVGAADYVPEDRSPIVDEAPNGTRRTSPLPRGHSIAHDGLELTVLDVSYSSEENGSYAPLEDNHLWAVVKLRLKAVGDPDKSYSYNTVDFRLVGERGVIYNDWIEAPKSDMGSGEFFGGATLEVNLVRQVHEDDDDIVLIYSPAFEESRFLALNSNPQSITHNGTNPAASIVSVEGAPRETPVHPGDIPESRA